MSKLSALKNDSKWVEATTGISSYHYEGQNTSDYNIPTSYVEVLVLRYNNARGIAFAVDWRNNNQDVWVNNLHDDTSSNKWGTWNRIIDSRCFSLSGTTLTINT